MKDEESKGRSEEPESLTNPDRRAFLQAGALAAGGAALAPLAADAQSDDAAAQAQRNAQEDSRQEPPISAAAPETDVAG